MIDIRGHRLVEQHFQGKSTPRAARRMFRHLRRCERCRNEYRLYSSLEELARDGETRAQERLARAIFPRGRRYAWGAGGFGIAVACAAFLLWFGRGPEPFQARGGATDPASGHSPGPSLGIYRVAPDGGARVGGLIAPDDRLAFSYSNPASDPFDFLMVFARDGAGRVYWFWPGWQSPAEDPASVAIAAAPKPVELGESVRHAFRPGPLTVIGLFSRRPYHAREVEAAVAGGVASLAKLEAVVWSQELEVVTSRP